MTNSINNASDVAAGNGKKVVNKVAYCLLALFLGGFGAHKFYQKSRCKRKHCYIKYKNKSPKILTDNGAYFFCLEVGINCK